MNDLLHKHGCANVFSVPEGLKELMSDVTREVLREQPQKIYDFISNYLSVLLITREHGIMAVKILDDLCDCRPTVSEHLIQVGLQIGEAQILSEIIKEEIDGFQASEGKETIKEYDIMKKILKKIPLDEVMAAKVCQVARNAFRDYWYRKQTMEKELKIKPKEPWEVAAQRTLELYRRTKPSPSELIRATEKIQAAYRGYYVRRNLLRHLRPKSKRKSPKVNLPGPPLDVAASREIDLGPLLNIKVREDDINAMFNEHAAEKLGLPYDPMRALTHVPDEEYVEETDYSLPQDKLTRVSEIQSQIPMTSSAIGSHSRAPSAVPSQLSEGKRQSRLPSQADAIRSRIGSKVDAVETIQKISFSEVPPVPVNTSVFADDLDVIGDVEIKEVLAPDTVEPFETDVLESEVPEDIPDDRIEDTEGDEGSAPIETIPSSAPETANTTDVEDEAVEELNVTDEGEG
ncbi:uncharacterized protein LOC126773487 [Nymphalis io]|uniref:uncharacterized protein LOC126773487 n=1 Tax=Inachis io TaxID=171585 RepID=UPI002166F4A5|nr:uncharacterized protein LOC126773487 [Nymphalis io]